MTATQVFRASLVVLMTLVGAFILFSSLRILIVLLVAILIASALRPIVKRLYRWRVPEGAAIILVYLGTALGIITLFVVVLPPVVNQLANYLQNENLLAGRIIITQRWVERQVTGLTGSEFTLFEPDDIRSAISDVVAEIQLTAPDMLDDISNVLGEAILVFVMGVYWLTSRDKAVNFILELFAARHRERARQIIDEIETSMGSYILGMLFVASTVGVANFVILTLLGVANAATIGFIIGVTTLLPIVGGFIGGGLATLLAVLTSPIQGVIVLITFILVQQVENYLLTPRVMSNSVGLDPLLVMVGIFVGFVMGGIVGGIISVPIMGMLAILLRYLVIEPRKADVSAYKIEQGGVLLVKEEPKPEVE